MKSHFHIHSLIKSIILLTVGLVSFSCSQQKEQTVTEPTPEAYSFSGQPFYAKPADSAVVAKADSAIAAIRANTDLSEDNFIEIGRQLVASNRFKLAVDNYSEALTKFPDSYKLLRHRGHRYINLRQLDKAIADLSKSEELIRTQPEAWEYDAEGKPSATYQHQIWYHIGLCHYLTGDFAAAASDFEKSLATATGGKNQAGASDWLYNCYQRSGQKEKAANVIKPFTPDFVIEDKEYPYFKKLLYYNGFVKREELVDSTKTAEQMVVGDITKLYAIASMHRYNGEKDKAREMCEKIILAKDAWQAFAYAGAEKDLLEK